MKRVFIIIAALLALVMAFTACGSQAPAATTAAPATEAATTAATTAAATEAATTAAATTAAAATTHATAAATAATTTSGTTAAIAAAEAPELIWFMGLPGVVPSDQAMVEAALNEISVPMIGARMKTIFMDNQQTMLAMSSGEYFDIAFTCEWHNYYATQSYAGYFADITDLLPEVTPALWSDMPPVVWDGARVNGRIYGVPVKKDYAAEMFWRFDKDLYEDLGMDIPDTMSFFEIEPYLTAGKQAYDDGNPLAKVPAPLSIARGGIGGMTSHFDMINPQAMLGIPYSALGTENENTVTFVVEHPDVLERLEAAHNWYNAGYINPDALQLDAAPAQYTVSPGQGFYGADAIWTGAVGYPIQISKFSGPYLSTASIRGSLNAFSARSPHVDLGIKLQELISTNQDYRDILRYGVMGVHWNVTSEGLAHRTQAGRDGYSVWPFSQGSYALSRVEDAEGVTVDPNMWEVIFSGYVDAKATRSIGFSFDPINVEAEIGSLQAIKDKYWEGLSTGTFNPKDTIESYVAEAETAGIRRVIEECQRQLDEFLATY